jgi:hypothetical protein
VEIQAPESSQEVLRRCLQFLRAPMPTGWTIVERDEIMLDSQRPDAVLTVTDPKGTTTDLVVEVKRVVERRGLSGIQSQLEGYQKRLEGAGGLLAARYLPPLVRRELELLGINYVDSTGNMRLVIDRPAIFLSDRATDKDPWRGPGRPRGSLKGEPAARVVRTLIDSATPMTISELIARSGASTGAVYRVREYLVEEGLIELVGEDKIYRLPDWTKLLREWAADYSTLDANITRRFIEPRGIQGLRARLANASVFRYAVTGSCAAEEWAPYAPVKSVFAYVDNVDVAADWLGLRPTASAPNVILVEPKAIDSAVFLGARRAEDGAMLASPSQVAADLLNGPGRSPAEAEELLSWMSRNEDVWRR